MVQRIRENIMFLEKPDEIEKKGGYVPGGILLWGPPGTGKTLMAEAVAGETGRPYVFVDPGAFINMFMGVGILKVKSLFRKLRKLALRYGGVIVFFDEADALGNRGSLGQTAPGGARGCGLSRSLPRAATGSPTCRRTPARCSPARRWRRRVTAPRSRPAQPLRHGWRDERRRWGMGTPQALLTELSGLKKPRGILNRWAVRPGHAAEAAAQVPDSRHDGDEHARGAGRGAAAAGPHRPDLPRRLPEQGRADPHLPGLPGQGAARGQRRRARQARHDHPVRHGATIKDLVNEALITAIRDGREVITWRDLMKAKQLKDLGLPEDVEYIERERHAVAVHEACHAVVAYRTRQHMEIDLATIEKGSDYLGMVASIPPEDQFTWWRSEYEADILVSLASLAGERMFFEGDSSSGVSGDLESATAVASFMEGYWAWGTPCRRTRRRGASRSAARAAAAVALEGREHREGAARGAGRPDRGQARGAARPGRGDPAENRTSVLAIAHALETHKTLTGEDVEAVVEGREGLNVDGRVYRDPVFVESLEAYHAAAAGAHRSHTSVKLALPPGGRRVLPAAEEGDTAAATVHEPSPYEPPR